MSDELRVITGGAVRIVTINRPNEHNVLQTIKRASSKHIAQAAVAIIDDGLAAETFERGADDRIGKVREFLGADKYDAIEVPEG